jgi:hypothetical protein
LGASYGFNWELYIPSDLQAPFIPSHENMADLRLDSSLPAQQLASNLRKAFSGIVAGNVKAQGVAQIRAHGPFQIAGEPEIMQRMESLLASFVEQKRMKIDYSNYTPCWEIVSQ